MLNKYVFVTIFVLFVCPAKAAVYSLNKVQEFLNNCFVTTKLVGTLLTISIASIPITANASVTFFDQSDLGGGGKTIIVTDFSQTPSNPDPTFPALYPVNTTSVTDSKTSKTTTTTETVIKSSKYSTSSGDEAGSLRRITTNNNETAVGFGGNTLSFSWDIFIPADETASLSIFLANPINGQSFGPEYSVEVTDSQSGSVNFNLVDIPLSEFDIFLTAIQTSTQFRPQTRISLTDIAIDNVSIADKFSVAAIPVPPALLLFASGLLALIFAKRKQLTGNI